MNRLRIATYNILSGGGTRWRAIGEMVQTIDADVLALQEIEDPRPMFSLAERLGYRAVFGRAPRFRHQGLLSRLPLREWRNHQDPRAFPRNSLEVSLDLPGGPVAIHTVHLTAAFQRRGRAEPDRLRELGAVREQAQGGNPDRHLILGDFNSLAPGERIDAAGFLSLLSDWRRSGALERYGTLGPVPARRQAAVGTGGATELDLSPVAREGMPRLPWVLQPLVEFVPKGEATDLVVGAMMPREVVGEMQTAGYVDCLRRLHPKGDEFTCPTYHPAVRIDYVFATPTLAGRLAACQVVGREGPLTEVARRASDHFPVVAEFHLERG